MIRKILSFFDKLEDRIRFHLSRWPVIYALIGAVGIILVWKGIWETAELFPILFGPASILLGILLLLATGLLVSFFIGDNIILSGYKHEKKITEKTEAEIKAEIERVKEITVKLDHIEREVHELAHKE